MGEGSINIGTAGWSIASRHAPDFPAAGSHLERYAQRLNCVEINSSFYKPHRFETYVRWAAAVPPDFRFSVKLPKAISHELRLGGADAALDAFLAQASGLGPKLSVLLVQLPPNLPFDMAVADAFFAGLRARTDVDIALEARHAEWFRADASSLLDRHRVARVIADPQLFEAAEPGTKRGGLAYFRYHGAPRIYYSDYPPERLEEIARAIAAATASAETVWCIFDNTAASHALGNALTTKKLVKSR